MGVFEDAVPNFDVVLEVTKIAVINNEGRTLKIEVEKNHSNPNIGYSARGYELRSVLILPEYDEKGSPYIGSPIRMRIWTSLDLPWVARENAESAMSQALSFLKSKF
jgi:hypothetical protein